MGALCSQCACYPTVLTVRARGEVPLQGLDGAPIRAQRFGWHSLRRKFATELKEIPLKDLCHLGGWKRPSTMTCYQTPDESTQRSALAHRKTLRAAGLSH